MQGVFDGVEPIGDLRKHGDFGLGTFDALDGEMIMIDGVVYQARSDGKVYTPPGSMTTPFAEVTFFDRDMTIVTEGPMNISAFSTVMTNALPSPNLPCAIRVHGIFPEMKIRLVPSQAKPYTSLAAAVQNQSV
jgi:acetolactate decarboxylase